MGRKLISERVYNCEVEIYGDRDLVISLLPSLKFLNHYLISPLHYKDIFDNGDYKKPHTHVYLAFNRNMSFKTIARSLTALFGFTVLPENITWIKGTLSDCYAYCDHSNCPDKPRYNHSDIVCDSVKRLRERDVYLRRRGEPCVLRCDREARV